MLNAENAESRHLSGLAFRISAFGIRQMGGIDWRTAHSRTYLINHRSLPRERAQRASHAIGARRRSGARERVSGSPRDEAPRMRLEAVALQASVEGRPAQAKRLGRLADVAVVARHR